MKEYLLTLTQQKEKPLKSAYASIMKLESDTRLKVIEEGPETRAIRYGLGDTLDSAETVSEPRVGVWLIVLAMLSLLVSYWVISRHGWF